MTKKTQKQINDLNERAIKQLLHVVGMGVLRPDLVDEEWRKERAKTVCEIHSEYEGNKKTTRKSGDMSQRYNELSWDDQELVEEFIELLYKRSQEPDIAKSFADKATYPDFRTLKDRDQHGNYVPYHEREPY